MKLLQPRKKFDLSKNERERLVAAAREMDLIARRFIEINLLRASLAEAAQDFINGKLPILEALALGSFRRPDHEEAQGNLMRVLKVRRREILDANTDLVQRLRAHAADVAQMKFDEAEQAERKHAKTLGLDDDDFRSSGNLERLAAEVYAAKDALNNDAPISDTDFARLLAAAGIATGSVPSINTDDED